jgi:alpha-1,4-digalacturonate transport system permease protein
MAAMRLSNMLGARRNGRGRPLHWTDIAAYIYLALGVILMFGPVLWLVLSSFKTQSALLEFPPSLLPFA